MSDSVPTASAEELRNRGWIVLAVMLGSVMQALDTTIANVALPRIQGALSATQEQMGWVLTSYIVGAAIMTPLAGWLTGPVGRKKVFLFSIALFTVSSAMCGIAHNLTELVLYRAIQGVAGASLVPLSLAILLDLYPKHQHGRATAMWGMGVTLGPILGPALGGWLTEMHSWRWVFLINVPFGVVAMLASSKFMHETQRRRTPFDFFGFAMLSTAIGSLQLMLDRGQLLDWFSSTEIIIEAAVAAVAFYLFLVHILTARQPFLSPSLFRDRNFALGSVFIFLIGIVLLATLALLPPLLEGLFDYPVVTIGLVTAPRGIGTFVAMIIVGRVIGKIDARVMLTFGLLTTALSLWLMTSFSPQMDSHLVIWSGVIQGFGLGFTWVPLTTIAFGTLEPSQRNEASAIFNLLRNIGSSIGVAVVTALLTRNVQFMHARLAEHITPYALATRTHPVFDVSTQTGLYGINGVVTHQATLIAYINDFKLLLIMTLAVTPLVLFLRRAQSGPAPVVHAD
ncbi:DHA2 family efflux MFS transporter permease subunit [Steroidobacter cummioxidans]|uniref:DHA2 family efflux MFS transporter permease subunit n=1 Tax=Steroidobacter cummioxidans TaxID=1803913 RepID=UPI0019D42BBF|nr:DHA2 family efflux MFS transporter permease subunit [Steroidobacter cummioxidans]